MASRTLPLVYGLAFILLVIPALGAHELGRYAIVFQTFNVIALLNKFLVLNPMLRFGTDPDQYDRVIRSGFYLSAAFYIASGSIIWLLSPVLASMLRIELADMRLVTLLMLTFFFRDFGFFVQQTIYRTTRIFFIEAVFFIGSIVGFVYLLSIGSGISAREALIVNAAAMAASSLLAIMLGFGGARLVGRPDPSSIRKIAGYGLETIPMGLSNSLIYSGDVLVLGVIFNPVTVGVYTGAKKVYQVVSAITQAVGILVLPYAARLAGASRKDDLRALFEKTTVYISIGLLGFAAIGWVSADAIYGFLGEEYTGCVLLLTIMLFAAPFEGLFSVAGNILYGAGEAGKVTRVSAGSLVVLLMLLLPGAYYFGGKGAALALAIGLTVNGVWMYRVAGSFLGSGLYPSMRRLAVTLKSLMKR